MVRIFAVFVAPALALSGCVSPPPAPPAAPAPRPAPPPPSPPPVAANWIERPVAPGGWVYRPDERGSMALFGIAGQEAAVTLRCDQAARRLFISLPGAVGGMLTLRATTSAKSYVAQPTGGVPPHVAAEIAPADPQLDAIAFSRGRFLVAMAGAGDLVVPAWPEVTRVVEDCRG